MPCHHGKPDFQPISRIQDEQSTWCGLRESASLCGINGWLCLRKGCAEELPGTYHGNRKKLEFRDYVDDITVTCRGFDEKQTTREFKEALEEVKKWLRANTMVLNDEKEQIYVSTEKWTSHGKLCTRITKER